MDSLTFIAHVLSAVAWPVAAIAIVLLLRKPLVGLLGVIRRLKLMGVEAEFDRGLGRAQELIDQRSTERSIPLTSPQFPEKNREWLAKLAELSPRSVILEAWREVEAAADKVLQRHEAEAGKQPNASVAITGKMLLDRQLINDDEFQVFTILRNLRNQAAHERQFKITKEDALEYAIMAQRLSNSLNALADKQR